MKNKFIVEKNECSNTLSVFLVGDMGVLYLFSQKYTKD